MNVIDFHKVPFHLISSDICCDVMCMYGLQLLFNNRSYSTLLTFVEFGGKLLKTERI